MHVRAFIGFQSDDMFACCPTCLTAQHARSKSKHAALLAVAGSRFLTGSALRRAGQLPGPRADRQRGRGAQGRAQRAVAVLRVWLRRVQLRARARRRPPGAPRTHLPAYPPDLPHARHAPQLPAANLAEPVLLLSVRLRRRATPLGRRWARPPSRACAGSSRRAR